MTEENQTSQPVKPPEQEIKELKELLSTLVFFSDQVRVNQVLHKGMSLTLEKLEEISKKQEEIKNLLLPKPVI